MKAFVLFTFFLFPVFLNAQISLNEWSAIEPVSDSSHHNRNACLLSSYYNTTLFWDQELDETTTQLCYRSLYPSFGEVHVALTIPQVKLTNPKILNLNQGSSSTDCIVFYQTDEGSDIDLKYFIYKSDGTISEPFMLANLQGDDVNLTFAETRSVAWENNGKVYYSEYNSQNNTYSLPFVVDSAGSNSPVFTGYNTLVYLKQNGDSTDVNSIYPVNLVGNWTKNKKSFPGNCSELRTNNGWGGAFLCMKNSVGTNPSGLIILNTTNFDAEYRNSPLYNYSQPAIANYMIAVKNSMYYFLVYVSDSLTQNEIFAETPFGYYPGTQNISQWQGDDRNPQLFESYPYFSIIRIHLVWESEREGFSTIYSSYFDYYFGSLAETPEPDNLSAVPCPFDRETTISFQSDESGQVTIYDLQGRKIKTLSSQPGTNGMQKAVWDGTNHLGNSVPAGCFVVSVKSENETRTRIVIKK